METKRYNIGVKNIILILGLMFSLFLGYITQPTNTVNAEVTIAQIKKMDVRAKTPSSVTASKIDDYVKNGWGKGMGKAILSACKKYGVNASIVVGQMKAENGIVSPAPKNGSMDKYNNPTGMKGVQSEVGKNGVTGLAMSPEGNKYLVFKTPEAGVQYYIIKVSQWANGKAHPEVKNLNIVKNFAEMWVVGRVGVKEVSSFYYTCIKETMDFFGDNGDGKATKGTGEDDAETDAIKSPEGLTGLGNPGYDPYKGNTKTYKRDNLGAQKTDLSQETIAKVSGLSDEAVKWGKRLMWTLGALLILTLTIALLWYVVMPNFGYASMDKIEGWFGISPDRTRKGIIHMTLVYTVAIVILGLVLSGAYRVPVAFILDIINKLVGSW